MCYRVTFFIAEACLLAGSVRNAYHTKYRTIFVNNPPSCETVRKGVFAAGAAFIVVTGMISEFYYISYSKARGSFEPYGGEASVGLGTYKWAIAGWSPLPVCIGFHVQFSGNSLFSTCSIIFLFCHATGKFLLCDMYINIQ